MDTSTERADAILDNRPAAGSGSQRLVYLLLLGIGLILIGVGAYVRFIERISWLPEVCIALGVAIAAPGILSYLYRKYMLEDIKLELQKPALEFKDTALHMMQDAMAEVSDVYRAEVDLLRSARAAGIYGVFISRTEAVSAFCHFLEHESTMSSSWAPPSKVCCRSMRENTTWPEPRFNAANKKALGYAGC
jgi:hypothetical protein